MQFSLRRMFQLTIVVAVIAAMFASLPCALALLILIGLNILACVWFGLVMKPQLVYMATATWVLLLAAVFLTDWGLSSPRPIVRIAWTPLIAGCVGQVLTIMLWFLSAPPSSTVSSPSAVADNTCPDSNSTSER